MTLVLNILAWWGRIWRPPKPAPLAARDPVERLEGELLPQPQVDIPLTHRFAPGVYLREVFMPAGTLVIGHRHNTEHFNIALTGRARVLMNGVVKEIVAPAVIKSEAGVRKVFYIEEDMQWQTVHPTHETDLQRLEADLIVKSDTWQQHQQTIAEVEQMKTLIANQSTVEAVCLG